jgi:hypothetical protein
MAGEDKRVNVPRIPASLVVEIRMRWWIRPNFSNPVIDTLELNV